MLFGGQKKAQDSQAETFMYFKSCAQCISFGVHFLILIRSLIPSFVLYPFMANLMSGECLGNIFLRRN